MSVFKWCRGSHWKHPSTRCWSSDLAPEALIPAQAGRLTCTVPACSWLCFPAPTPRLGSRSAQDRPGELEVCSDLKPGLDEHSVPTALS